MKNGVPTTSEDREHPVKHRTKESNPA